MRLYLDHFNAHFLLYAFFADDFLLVVYYICILDYGNNVRQKAKLKRFSYVSSKWVIKQQRQLTTSTMHLAQELLTNIQCSGGSRSFAKEMRALKMRSIETSHQ